MKEAVLRAGDTRVVLARAQVSGWVDKAGINNSHLFLRFRERYPDHVVVSYIIVATESGILHQMQKACPDKSCPR